MSATLIEKRPLVIPRRSMPTRPKLNRVAVLTTAIKPREKERPIRSSSVSNVAYDSNITYEEEMRFVEKAVAWMSVLAVMPLILFHIITYLYPDIFMIPIVP